MILSKIKNDELVEKMAEIVCDDVCVYPRSGLPEEALCGICEECELGSYWIEINNRLNEGGQKVGIRERFVRLLSIPQVR